VFRSQLRKIGNSRGILLPREIVSHLRLEEGDPVDIAVDGARIVVTRVVGEGEDLTTVLDEVLAGNEKVLAELAKR
jgi:putative addiction module antidote